MAGERTRESRLAIGHDWLLTSRGAERLLTEFCRGRQDLSIHTLFFDASSVNDEIRRQSIFVSRWNSLPGVARHYRLLLPWLPRAAERMSIRDADVLITISHSVAKGFGHPGIPHVCYCLSPMRYLWEPQLYGRTLEGTLRGRLLDRLQPRLKAWDLAANRAVDRFVAISETVRERIRRFYDLDSTVIHPCVDLDLFRPADADRDDYYLVVSALVPQKRLELAVEAFRRNGRRLLIAGSGPCLGELKRSAGGRVEFLGWRRDDEIRFLYQRAKGLIFPGTEDFGLVPLEAQACGCPILAYRAGGVTETTVEGETGLFFDDETPDSLNRALERFERTRFDPAAVRRNAERFSRSRFRRQWRELLDEFGLRIFPSGEAMP